MRSPLPDIRGRVLAALCPPVRQPLSRWAEANLFLPAGLSAIPGRLALWQFQRELADALTDPRYERVSVIKGARLGYSTLLLAAIAYYIQNDPTSILAVLPTEDDVRSFVVTQLEPALAASPGLRGALAIRRSAESRDTLSYRQFSGGALRAVAARSPRNLRAHTARVLIVDEADGMEVTSEGSPILLAEKRTMSFDNRKIIVGSTPTDTRTSHVHAAYEASDKRIFECRCPSCDAFNEVRWADIRWPEGKPEEAAWACPSCGVLHPESAKGAMVAGGRWRATAPHVHGHAGFRLSCLIAPHGPAAWPKLAAEFLAAKRQPETLRTFINTVLGEPWNDDGDDAPQPGDLQSLAEPIGLAAIPAEVLFLASGVDVQIDRLEVGTVGFTAADDWLFLDHRVIFGDPTREEVWRDLDDCLRERYRHPAGGYLTRDATCVDAGDGNVMQRVLSFAAAHRAWRVVAIKGAYGVRPPLARTESKRARGLHILGVDPLKGRLFDRLSRNVGVRFSDTLPGAWYEQLMAERRVIRYTRGQPHTVYERYPGRRAESLDCCVYALAARSLIGTDVGRRLAVLQGKPAAAVMPTTIRSAWLERH